MGIAGRHLPPVVRRLDRSLTVFVLHEVCDEPAPFIRDNDLWASERLFRTQMEFVAENFNVISAETWLRGEVPTRAALITFDDGYRGIFKFALPALAKMGLPSIVFMNMSPVSGGNFWSEQVTYLCQNVETFQNFLIERQLASRKTVRQANTACSRELVDAYEREYGNAYLEQLSRYVGAYATPEDLNEADGNPLVVLGNHLFTHYNVRILSESTLKEQYQRNEAALSQFKRYIPVFAFPFGQPGSCFTAGQVSFLLHLGALRLFTSWTRPNADHTCKLLDRVGLTSAHDNETRMWLQVVKGPVMEIFGGGRPAIELGPSGLEPRPVRPGPVKKAHRDHNH